MSLPSNCTGIEIVIGLLCVGGRSLQYYSTYPLPRSNLESFWAGAMLMMAKQSKSFDPLQLHQEISAARLLLLVSYCDLFRIFDNRCDKVSNIKEEVSA